MTKKNEGKIPKICLNKENSYVVSLIFALDKEYKVSYIGMCAC